MIGGGDECGVGGGVKVVGFLLASPIYPWRGGEGKVVTPLYGLNRDVSFFPEQVILWKSVINRV